MRNIRPGLLALALVGAALLAMGTNCAAADEKVLWAINSADATYGPWFYAQEKGFFKKYGLDTTMVAFDSGAKGIQGLEAGSVDIEAADGSSFVNGRIAGLDLRAIGVTLGVLSGKIIAAKDINSPQDLKGKKYAISSFGSESHMAEQLFLKASGLTDADVIAVQVGNQGNRFAALETGQVSVSSFLPPLSAKVEAMGYHVLAQLPDLAPEYMSVAIVIKTSVLEKRRPMVVTLIKAVVEATAAYKKDRAGGIEVIMKTLRSSESDAAAAWDYYAPLYNVTLRPTPKSVQFLLDQSTDPKAKMMKPEEFYDLSVLDELDKSGFFKTVN